MPSGWRNMLPRWLVRLCLHDSVKIVHKTYQIWGEFVLIRLSFFFLWRGNCTYESSSGMDSTEIRLIMSKCKFFFQRDGEVEGELAYWSGSCIATSVILIWSVNFTTFSTLVNRNQIKAVLHGEPSLPQKTKQDIHIQSVVVRGAYRCDCEW